jgi:hypothetical protein
VTSALYAAFAIGYNTPDSYLYLIPVLVCLGFWFGAGVDWLIRTASLRARWAGRLAVASAIILPVVAAALRFPTMDLGGDREPSEFEAAVLLQAPHKAIILSQQDAHTFALWYYQHARGRRPDVAVVDTGLLGYKWYNAQLVQRIRPGEGVSPPVGAVLAEGSGDLDGAATVLGRPVCRIDPDRAGLTCARP